MPNPAAVAAQAVIEELKGRRGFDAIFDGMDDDVKFDLYDAIKGHIEEAFWKPKSP